MYLVSFGHGVLTLDLVKTRSAPTTPCRDRRPRLLKDNCCLEAAFAETAGEEAIGGGEARRPLTPPPRILARGRPRALVACASLRLPASD